MSFACSLATSLRLSLLWAEAVGKQCGQHSSHLLLPVGHRLTWQRQYGSVNRFRLHVGRSEHGSAVRLPRSLCIDRCTRRWRDGGRRVVRIVEQRLSSATQRTARADWLRMATLLFQYALLRRLPPSDAAASGRTSTQVSMKG